ncbi:CDC50/LEM3 family, partial [Trinorchestia longiramus]
STTPVPQYNTCSPVQPQLPSTTPVPQYNPSSPVQPQFPSTTPVLCYVQMMRPLMRAVESALRGLSTDSGDQNLSGVTRGNTVKALERKVVNLQGQVVDLHSRIIEAEKKAALEKRRKLDSKFKQKFKQQRLPAWQPILTADTVLPAFFLIGLLFVPLGVALLLFSNGVVEYEVDYTDCKSIDEKHKNAVGVFLPCKDVITETTFSPGFDFCHCEISLNITETMESPVYMYYGLDNFYQNHRRYVKSRDDKQLAGKVITQVSSDCSPFDKNDEGLMYAPCGAIANSLFNDTLELYKGEKAVLLRGDDIAWDSDRNIKFKNPPGALNDGENGVMLHYSAVCVVMLHYSAECIVMLHYSAECVVMLHYSAVCVVMQHYSAVCVVMQHYSAVCVQML